MSVVQKLYYIQSSLQYRNQTYLQLVHVYPKYSKHISTIYLRSGYDTLVIGYYDNIRIAALTQTFCTECRIDQEHAKCSSDAHAFIAFMLGQLTSAACPSAIMLLTR